MRRAKRNAAKLLSAAMAVGMMAGMAVPAAAEEESTNIWASDVDTSEPMELKMYLIGDRTPAFDEVYGKINEILDFLELVIVYIKESVDSTLVVLNGQLQKFVDDILKENDDLAS